MASPDFLIAHVRNEVNQIVSDIEKAQAKAATIVQMWDKLQAANLFAGYDWTGSDIDGQDFLAAINTLQNFFPDIFGANGASLYLLKW